MKREKKVKIQEDVYYSLKDIFRNKFIPRARAYPSVVKRVMAEEKLPPSKRILRAIKVGEGKAAKYAVLGRNLLRYIQLNQ